MSNAIKPMKGLLFGCDPELFIVNSEGNPVCADGLIPGTKENPYKVKGGAVQVDGMAAEINIDPVDNYDDFSTNINSVMSQLRKMLPQGYSLLAAPSVVFSEEEWEKAPARAKELGCNPDFNAWTGAVNPPPNGDVTPRMRTGAGHLHIGWTDGADTSDADYVNAAMELVRQLDWYLGGWSAITDKDSTRRSLYGKAGAMRFKPYGAEYRVLSNWWLNHPSTRLAVWNRMQRAIHDMRDRYLPEKNTRYFDFDTSNIRLRNMIDTSTTDNDLISIRRYPIMSVSL